MKVTPRLILLMITIVGRATPSNTPRSHRTDERVGRAPHEPNALGDGWSFDPTGWGGRVVRLVCSLRLAHCIA